MTRILLSGAGGWIGAKLRAHLSRKKHTVISVGEDILHSDGFSRLSIGHFDRLNSVRNDILVLCGASYYKGDAEDKLAEMVAYNVDYTTKLIDQFIARGGSKILFFSSYLQLFENDRVPYAKAYVYSKDTVLSYLKNLASVELLNIYLYDNWHNDDTRSKFLPLLLNALRTGSRFEIPSPGTLINLCTTESLIRTLGSLIENFEARQWSLCAPKTHTLKEVAAAFIRSENGDECVTFGSVPPLVRQLPFVDCLELENIRI